MLLLRLLLLRLWLLGNIGQQKGAVAIVALYDELISVGKRGIVQVFENVAVFDDFFNEALLRLEMHDDEILVNKSTEIVLLRWSGSVCCY